MLRQLNYDDEVSYEEEFDVELVLNDFETDVYDVKIDILGNGVRIARIWNGDAWQSTYNYLNDAIDLSQGNEKSFKLNITESYNGDADIEIKIRDSKGKAKTFSDYKIGVVGTRDGNKQNNTDNENQGNGNNGNISLEIDWNEDDIVNGEEFEVEIDALDLEDKEYDVRVWIEDNGNVISDRYDEENEEWKSGTYYIYNCLKGPGNDKEKIKLKIREDYNKFEGDAKIFLKIRDGIEINEGIEVLEYKEEDKETKKETKNETVTSTNADDKFYKEFQERLKEEVESGKLTGNVIQLGSKTESPESGSIKSKNSIVYESKNELIKKYSIYGFGILIALLCILLLFNRLR